MSELKKQIKKINKGYFSFADLRKIIKMDDSSLRVAISRMIKIGEIKKLFKGYYCLDLIDINWEKLAIEIYRPSYLSFEWALGYYNILSQKPYNLILATTKRSRKINVLEKMIIFRHIQPKLYWGYVMKDKYLIAEPEKAFLDLAYLSLNGYAKFDREEMNLNLLNRKKIKVYLRKIKNKKLNSLLKDFLLSNKSI
ncbi:MAG: type IV toxin-antitoxin system AbiEi family antitoxin domain-containing protein [Patescibacteria group bacterium]